RQESAIQCAFQHEFVAEFPIDKRMQSTGRSPATEEIDASPSQLAGARSREHEVDTSLFNEPVYLIEQFGQLLNLVHNDQPVAPFSSSPRRAGRWLRARKTSPSSKS